MLTFHVCLCYLLIINYSLAYHCEYKQQWLEFKKTYNKKYENLTVEKQRFHTFILNQKKISKHNMLHNRGIVTYKLKSNQFADLSHEEFVNKYLDIGGAYKKRNVNGEKVVHKLSVVSLPSFVDWRENGTVTDVMTQGACRSSYTFSATGVLEGQYQLKTGDLIKFSEQNLIDCSDRKYNNGGCKGGTVAASLKFVADNHGIDTEQSYPYQGEDGRSCQMNGIQMNISINSVNRLASGQEWLLQTAIATVGPISVEFDASLESFQFYSSGIYYDFQCSKTNGNYFGLAIGYGTKNRLGYYIVKNSIGPSWGENGYIRMARFRGNNCGIATNAIYPII